MDDLARARVELALLEEKARELLKEFLGVRASIATQRANSNKTKRDQLLSNRAVVVRP